MKYTLITAFLLISISAFANSECINLNDQQITICAEVEALNTDRMNLRKIELRSGSYESVFGTLKVVGNKTSRKLLCNLFHGSISEPSDWVINNRGRIAYDFKSNSLTTIQGKANAINHINEIQEVTCTNH